MAFVGVTNAHGASQHEGVHPSVFQPLQEVTQEVSREWGSN